MRLHFSVAAALLVFTTSAFAGSIGSYSGCKALKGSSYDACMKCVGSGSFYQPGQGCGMVEGMHRSKSAGTEKPPPRPKSMPKTGKDYVTITPTPFKIGARRIDPDKDEGKELFDVTITLTHPFLMKTTEVTQGEWLFVLGSVTTSYNKACGLDCPANAVSWQMAIDYLNALSKLEKLEPCYETKKGLVHWKGFECSGYRLPTEAEWEFAARGGSEEPRYGELDEIAWYYDNANSTVHPVGKKKKNAYGLYDVLGNVWEWTWDAEDFKPYTDDMTDPLIGGLDQESDGQSRIIRGGSFRDSALYVRVQHRFQNIANAGGEDQGFRPVRTILPKK